MEQTTDVHELLLSMAEEIGATHSRIVSTDTVRIDQAVRASCESNGCGRYGKSWACPPAIGGLAELEARFRSFPEGLMVQNITELEDSWDFEGMDAAIVTHNAIMRDLAGILREALPDYEILVLGAGGCHHCEKCTYPDAACNFPELAIPSVEGYGVYVKPMVESTGLKYINGEGTVSYVGMILYRRK